MTPQKVYVVTHDSEIVGIYQREEDAEAIWRLTIESKGTVSNWTDVEGHYLRDQVTAEDQINEIGEGL